MSEQFETAAYTTDGAVATVLLNRPEALNSFNTPLRRDVAAALKLAAGDASVRVVVLGGAGRVFSAGADLKTGLPTEMTIETQLLTEYRPCFDAIIGMDKPVISAIHGSASGIGLSLAMVCDLAVMAEDAFLLAPFGAIGLVPDGGLTWMLPRHMGRKVAYQVCIECERIPSAQAYATGLVNRVTPAGEALVPAQQWAAQIATRAPISLALTKKLMREAMAADFASAFCAEASAQNICAASEDTAEGVAAFFARRPPQFRGR